MSVTEADVLAAANKYDVADVLVLPLARRQLGGSGMALRAALLRCERLEELDLTGNALESLEWLGGLPAAATLRKLTLTQNGLASLKGAGALNSLEHLMVQANCLRGVDDLALDELASLPSLHSLYLANVDGSQPNPACSDPGYRAAVLGALPKLRILDGERLDGPGSAAFREACGSHAGMGLDELDAAASGAEEDFVAAHARAEAELADAADLDAMLRGGLLPAPGDGAAPDGAGARLAALLAESSALASRAKEAVLEAERRNAVEGALAGVAVPAQRAARAGRRA
eukprot:PRCOL_00004797-RA